MFKIYLEMEAPVANVGPFKIYDQPVSRKEGVCLAYIRNRNRQIRGRVQDLC